MYFFKYDPELYTTHSIIEKLNLVQFDFCFRKSI
jgi:hypothetical protein